MNRLRLKGAWNQFKGGVRQRSATGADAGNSYGRGQDEQIIGSTQSALGRLQDRMRRIFSNPP